MKTMKIIHWISTGLITALMLMSSGMYFFNHEMVAETFTNLGFPTYIIYPLAIAKILGLLAIWSNYSKSLKEWAYAGFFFDFVLASSAHLAAKDGQSTAAMAAIVVLFVSYFTWKKISSANASS